MHTPTMLVILDGFGHRNEKKGNAIALANMPFWHSLHSQYPSTQLSAAGSDVGLLDGFMGNSEVGHLTLGAGRIIPSPLKKIHDAINNGSLAHNTVLLERLAQLKKSGGVLHFMGLLSDAGVHSHQDHLHALLKIACDNGIASIFIHPFLDGRDTPPRSAATYLEQLQTECARLGRGAIASIQGRFYAMDRDNNLDRTQKSYDVLYGLISQNSPTTWPEALAAAYSNNIDDEFVPPTLINPQGVIKPGDGVIFFNFRPDRARQLTQAFIGQNNNKPLAFFITAARYDQQFTNDFLFEETQVEQTLLDEIARQTSTPPPVFIVAETEKYAHVTYFFRGMREIQLPQEQRTLAPSIKAKNYIEHPEMSAPTITSTLIRSLRSKPAYFYLVNYANADMVGHSGNLAATIKACECLDQQLALLYHEVVERLEGTLIITADHGNAEEKIDEQGNPLTAHTANSVPFVVASKKSRKKGGNASTFDKKPTQGLAHVAPTILALMGLTIPSVMEQKTIF